MTLLALPPPLIHEAPPEPPRPRRPSRVRLGFVGRLARRLTSEGGIVGVSAFALYLVVAVLLDFKYLSFPPDAISRMANGSYVLYARDPHLAAIGFVWNPLMSVCDMVLLLLRPLWPALATHNMAGSLVTVICMVGAVHQLCMALREWGVRTAPRLVLTLLFALNPMIVYYAANGMSEALFIFTLLAATRYLARWLLLEDLKSLVYGATALGLCYLARNEAIGPAVAGAAVVFVVSLRRADGPRRSRIMMGLTDVTIWVMPAFVACVGWAAASYVITGQPFQQFTSQYGTSSQLVVLGEAHIKVATAALYEERVIAHMAPLLPVILIGSMVFAVIRRQKLILAPLAVLGVALAFDMAAYLEGGINRAYRYFIVLIPLCVVLVGVVLARPGTESTARARAVSGRWRPALAGVAGAALAATLIGPSLGTTVTGMFDPAVDGNEEIQTLGFIFHKHLNAEDKGARVRYATILAMGRYIAGLHRPNGDIVVDNFTPCIPDVIETIADPKVFVIPNDRDFQRRLANPLVFHAHYILDSEPIGESTLTATNRIYPTLYKSGTDTAGVSFATLAHQFPGAGLCPPFRLYRVDRAPSQAGA